MNKVILIGHLGKDPVLKDANGTKVCSVSLATSEKFKDKSGEIKEVTDWHGLVFWGAQAENIAKYTKKGSPLAVEGKQKTRSYEKDGAKVWITEVQVLNFQFLGGAKKDEDQGAKVTAPAEPKNGDFDEITDGDLPF